ncbi:MAG: elongation factor G, partial [Gaiellaceae bacterium]
MATAEPRDIRNVAVVGHRGAGKTSLVEAMLFQSGATTRLGSIQNGTTVADWDEDEHHRQMSLNGAICHALWDGRKINILDTPGDAGFVADSLAALRVTETALVVVNGVAGVEVQTGRQWARCEALGRARMLFVNMLDRERADFDVTLATLQEQIAPECVALTIPLGSEQELSGVIDVLHQRAISPSDGGQEATAEIPESETARAQAAREQLVEAVVETDETLMERYLEGEQISADELVATLRRAVASSQIFPVVCGAASANIGTSGLLDAIAQISPSPEDVAAPVQVEGSAAFIFKTVADPFAGRISVLRAYGEGVPSDSVLTNSRAAAKERIGHLLTLQGKEHESVEALRGGDIGAVAKLKESTTGDMLVGGGEAEMPPIEFPQPVMSFALQPREKGEEDKVIASLRRLAEEDPTLIVQRDERTGEQLLAGMSQVHVEVAVDRLKNRFGLEVDLQQPRVPYLETIRKQAQARHRHKKQTGGRGQFGECTIVVEPVPGHEGYEFVDEIVGGVIPQGFRPAVDKGIQESMSAGSLAGAPVQGVKVRLVDGQYHNVDSSEMAFKIAGAVAFKEAYQAADPVLLEPVMSLEVTVPDDSVGSVNGDLNSRRARLLGMEPTGGMTAIHAEVPMAEILTYSQALTSLTGGRGDYTT